MARKKNKNYDEMNVEELRDAAAEADIPGRSGMNKEELISALKGDNSESQQDRFDPVERPRESDEQDQQDQNAVQDKAPDLNVVDTDDNWNPPPSAPDPSGGGIPADSERGIGDLTGPAAVNTRLDPATGEIRRLPRNHPDFDPRQESVSTNPTRVPPHQPAPEDWPDPYAPSKADLAPLEIEDKITDTKPRQCSMGGTGPFVRAGNRIINMAHVLVVNISSDGSDLNHTASLSMSHGGAVTLSKEETCALMHVMGDCCEEEIKTRKNAVKAKREMLKQRAAKNEKEHARNAQRAATQAPRPHGPSQAEQK